jgi:DNA-binding transcriptional ArsR family regulator
MKHGPGIARIAALIGDPARANMLTALTGGAALTASELTLEAGVTKQTASSHLAKLSEAGLVSIEKQGRHRYYRLADDDIAQLLESLMGLAAKGRQTRVRPGPREPALRHARVCYDHLAGDLGVALYDGLVAQRIVSVKDGSPRVTNSGENVLAAFGIDVADLARGSRPLCRACLDWSVRRHHLAGALGSALLDRFIQLGWARRRRDSRIVDFSPAGETGLRRRFAA